ncbi:MAG: DUF4365 domain-containing protein [Chloroflexi bacterium]|nr:DUF4365 domain-containing protein [Chloroflexota bacterium]
MGNRRSSIQLEQEQKSRHQLAERLIDFGWHCTSPSPDLGEDFIVDIYHDGQNTGVNFYIQEKSVTNLASRKTKDDYLVYPLKVKDLKHWKSFSLPVALVIWDVILREGRWCLVKDMISYLDQNNPKWRKNKSDVQVYVPWKNNTSDEGLRRLKVEIGKQVYPLISFGKDLSINMKLAFPKTPDGMNLQKAFDLHIKEGEPVTIKGDVIQELKFSDWWETWFGGFDLKNAEIHIGEISHDRPVPISFKIIPTKGKTVSLLNLEFKPIRVGTEFIKFSNEHTSCPLLLTLSMRREGDVSQGSLTFLFRHVGGEPHEIMGFLNFAKAMVLGGKLRVEFHDINQSTSTDFPSANLEVIDPIFSDLVQKLCVIQDKTGHFVRIPNEGISRKDANAILELFEIVEHGEVHYTDSIMSLGLKGDGLKMLLDLHKQGKPIHLVLDTPDSYVELFGEKIKTGPMKRDTTGFVEMRVQEIEAAINVLLPEEALDIKLVKVNGTETLSDWQSGKL